MWLACVFMLVLSMILDLVPLEWRLWRCPQILGMLPGHPNGGGGRLIWAHCLSQARPNSPTWIGSFLLHYDILLWPHSPVQNLKEDGC